MVAVGPPGAADGSVAVVTSAHGRPDHLVPLDAVPIGHRLVVPDLHRPVAAVIEDGAVVRWLTWPSAPMPERAVEEAEAWPTGEGVWVVYRSDGIDDATRTAVYLDPDRVGAAVDLGGRRLVAADPGGLWLADPRDASVWMAGAASDDEDDDELAELVSSDLAWAEVGSFWPDPATWTEPEDDDNDAAAGAGPHEDDADDDRDDGGTTVMTAYQWAIGFADAEDHAGGVEDADPADDPGPPAPTPPTELVRIAPDGARTTIRVDHLVEGVTVEGDRMALRFHPTGPDLVPGAYGSRDVVYRPREVVVDVSDGLPAVVVTDALDSIPVEDPAEYDAEAADAEWERSVEEREARRGPWIERLDLTAVEGTRWPRWDAGEASRERSVARLVDEFTHLADPVIGWSRGVDGPRRLRSDYRDVRVEVEGEWPDTEVVVSFEHTAVPFLRLRRRYRVFDDTGRPVDHGYVTVYLEEEIATGDVPPRSAAVDGVLDI